MVEKLILLIINKEDILSKFYIARSFRKTKQRTLGVIKHYNCFSMDIDCSWAN